MYTEYFGLTEEPFSIAANPRFLYMSTHHREALAHLLYGVRSESCFVLLTGEVGTGKTTVCRCLLEQLPMSTDVAFILNPKLTVVELMWTICDELQIPYPEGNRSVKVFVDALNAHLLASNAEGRNTVLLIDEAQNLSADVLEQLRLLTNLETNERKLLQIILIGQPELDNQLALLELRQLSQRITARYRLRPLQRSEIGGYVQHRLAVAGRHEPVFSQHVLSKLYRKTRGVPRLVNVICDRAMLGAYTKARHTVNGAILDKAAREISQRGRAPGSGRVLPLTLASSALLIGAATAAAVYYKAPRQSPALPAVAEAPLAARDVTAVTLSPAARNTPPVPKDVTAVTSAPGTSTVAAPRPAAETGGHAVVDAAPQTVLAKADPAGRPALEAGIKLVPEPAQTPAASAGEVLAIARKPERSIASQAPPKNETPETGIDHTLAALAASPPNWPAESATASGTLESAFASLFSQWGLRYRTGSVDACSQARQQGLRCYPGAGNLGSLHGLDRPAVLTLRDPQGRDYYATLTGLGAETATLVLGEKLATVAIRDLESRWLGKYVLLWRPPPLGFGVVRPGSRGEHVQWLSERLARIAGGSDSLRGRRVFDAELVERVKAFQRSRGLAVDGIAGRQTVIRLNSATDASVPRIVGTGQVGGAG